MAAHDPDAIALACLSLIGSILDELNKDDPGATRRIADRSYAGQQAGPNDPRVLAIINLFRQGAN
jgi:hypothetical protein